MISYSIANVKITRLNALTLPVSVLKEIIGTRKRYQFRQANEQNKIICRPHIINRYLLTIDRSDKQTFKTLIICLKASGLLLEKPLLVVAHTCFFHDPIGKYMRQSIERYLDLFDC